MFGKESTGNCVYRACVNHVIAQVWKSEEMLMLSYLSSQKKEKSFFYFLFLSFFICTFYIERGIRRMTMNYIWNIVHIYVQFELWIFGDFFLCLCTCRLPSSLILLSVYLFLLPVHQQLCSFSASLDCEIEVAYKRKHDDNMIYLIRIITWTHKVLSQIIQPFFSSSSIFILFLFFSSFAFRKISFHNPFSSSIIIYFSSYFHQTKCFFFWMALLKSGIMMAKYLLVKK